MEREYLQKNSEAQGVTLLEKINQALAELGSMSKLKHTPEFLDAYAPLKDKTIVMVDDEKIVLENFAPHLITATNGKASCIMVEIQELDDIVRQITEHAPDIVLMDYSISMYFTGADVARTLKKQGFTGEILGFSSEDRATKEFIDAGAVGAVIKEAYNPEKSVEELARVISKR